MWPKAPTWRVQHLKVWPPEKRHARRGRKLTQASLQRLTTSISSKRPARGRSERSPKKNTWIAFALSQICRHNPCSAESCEADDTSVPRAAYLELVKKVKVERERLEGKTLRQYQLNAVSVYAIEYAEKEILPIFGELHFFTSPGSQEYGL
jgi:hypothetical protein